MGMTLTNLPDISCQLSRIRSGLPAAGPLGMAANQIVQDVLVFLLADRFEIDHVEVAERVEQLLLVEHVGDAAAHAGGKIAAGAADDDHRAAGHVFAAVIADPLDDRHARRCCGRRTARRPGR